MTDVIIIGAGPAGMTAGVYALRAGLTALIFEEGVYGGQVALTSEVENYPSHQKISGWELAQSIYDHAAAAGAKVSFEQVLSLDGAGAVKTVVTNQGRHDCRAVILANGAKRRKLGCPGEQELTGRGVSYCATCDGAFFRGKTVCVVGGGNTAMEDALFLANLAQTVYLVHRRGEFRGEKHLQDAVLASEKIQILYDTGVEAITGGDRVEAVTLKDLKTGQTRQMDTDAVFIAIGLEPDNEKFASVVTLDAGGYVVAGEDCRTNVPGIFAAGDTRTKAVRQIITAAADGAVAATGAANYLNAERRD